MQLDMNNIQHRRLRKLLAELVGLHANCLHTQGVESAQIYQSMAVGISRVCAAVLVDYAAADACLEVHEHMYQHDRAFIASKRSNTQHWAGEARASDMRASA